jgi:hypothetical protein
MKQTATLLKYDQRRALIGWSDGTATPIQIPEYLDPSEIRAMLDVYADPVFIKYGTVVQVPVTSRSNADDPSLIVDIEYEMIELQKCAVMGDTGIAFTVWIGYSPGTDRWYVRNP